MRLLVDGDSCPANRRAILVKAGARIGEMPLFFVNEGINITSEGMRIISCRDADEELYAAYRAGDIAITRDLLLAERLLALLPQGGTGMIIDYCGRLLTPDALRERLSYRDALLSGALTQARGKDGSLRACVKAFADRLDRIISAASTREGT